jgi:hypothetical protein
VVPPILAFLLYRDTVGRLRRRGLRVAQTEVEADTCLEDPAPAG